MKICTKCQILQPLENFIKKSSTKNGLRSQCKSCDKQYRDNNKQRIAKSKIQWYENNKEMVLKQK